MIKKYRQTWILLLISLILIINSYLLSILKFNAVIYYEQNIFPERLIHFAYFFILPFVVYTIYHIFKISIKNKKLLIIITAFVLTSSVYLAYPTFDVIEKNKGYSVSQADTDAVHKIQEVSDTDNFVVLANQSTSAAALQEFGFKKYFKDNFYYPIPTSSELYKIYLDISYKGIKDEYIQQVKNLTGADTIYLVFNDYWTNFKKLVPEAQANAINSFEIGNNQIWIFEY